MSFDAADRLGAPADVLKPMRLRSTSATGPLAAPGADTTPAPPAIAEFTNLQDAIEAATHHGGDEMIVGYEGEDGQIRYAVLEINSPKAQSSHFDPSTLQFADAGIVTAIVVDEHSPTGRMEHLNSVRTVYQDQALRHLADSSLDLARAALTRVDVGGHRDDYIRGFRAEGGNSHWGTQVKSNRLHVLTTVNTTMAAIDARIRLLDEQIPQVRALGDTSQAETLERQRQTLLSQRQELDTYQEVLRAELVTDSTDHDTPVPGLQDSAGRAVTVGACRSDPSRFRAVIDALSARRAALIARQGNPPDPAIVRQVATLDGAVQALTRKQGEIVAAQAGTYRRLMALSEFGQEVNTGIATLQGIRETLTTLDMRSTLTPADGAPLAEAQARGRQALARLIGTRDANSQWQGGNLEQATQRFERAGGAREAVALLRSELAEMRTLASADTVDVQRMVSQLNAVQSQLLTTLEGMGRIFDGITPAEVQQLRRIDTRVETFRTLYRANEQQMGRLMDEVRRATQLAERGYRGLSLQGIDGLRAAQQWSAEGGGLNPYDTNQQIVGMYNSTANDWRSELGVDGVFVWFDAAGPACNTAGEKISLVMTAVSALHTLVGSSDGSGANDMQAVAALAGMLQDPHLRGQVMSILGSYGEDVSRAVEQYNRGNRSGALATFRHAATGLAGTPAHLLRAFVQGNTEIAHNVLSAQRVYQQARAAGKTPAQALDAVRIAIRGREIADPSGTLLRSFSYHVEAVETASRMRRQGASADAIREAVQPIELQAAIALGWREQAILQTNGTFGDESVARVVGGNSQSESLRLATGASMPLTANWSDLSTRMGATMLEGREAAQQFIDSLPPSQAADARRLNPNLPPRSAHPSPRANEFWTMHIVQPNEVIRRQDGSQVPAGTVLFFRTQLPPPEGTAARAFVRMADSSDQMHAGVLQAQPPAHPPTYYHHEHTGSLTSAITETVTTGVSMVFGSADSVATGPVTDSTASVGTTPSTLPATPAVVVPAGDPPLPTVAPMAQGPEIVLANQPSLLAWRPSGQTPPVAPPSH